MRPMDNWPEDLPSPAEMWRRQVAQLTQRTEKAEAERDRLQKIVDGVPVLVERTVRALRQSRGRELAADPDTIRDAVTAALTAIRSDYEFVSPIDGHRHFAEANKVDCAVCDLEADRDRLRGQVDLLEDDLAHVALTLVAACPEQPGEPAVRAEDAYAMLKALASDRDRLRTAAETFKDNALAVGTELEQVKVERDRLRTIVDAALRFWYATYPTVNAMERLVSARDRFEDVMRNANISLDEAQRRLDTDEEVTDG